MAETPEERLARLRREVESSWVPPHVPQDITGPQDRPAPDAVVAPDAAVADPAAPPVRSPVDRAALDPVLTPPPGPPAPDETAPIEVRIPTTPAGAADASGPQPWVPVPPPPIAADAELDGPLVDAPAEASTASVDAVTDLEPSPPARPREGSAVEPNLTPPPERAAPDVPVAASVRIAASPPGAPGAGGPQPWAPPQRPAPVATSPVGAVPSSPSSPDGWSLADALGGASLGQWVGIGLVAVGGYLLLAAAVPSIALPGSFVMAVAGVILLWLHLSHRSGAWALYAGAALAAVGGLRVVAEVVPFEVRGETSLGLGLALVAIAWLRHRQAGGWGWQGIVGAVLLGWGALQFGLGLLPGSPGVLDLVLPLVILGAGVLLVARAMRRPLA